MPLATVFTSVQAPAEKSAALLGKLSSALATALSKPEAYVMTRLAPGAPMTFGGSPDPCCAVEIKSIGGLTTRTTKSLSEVVCTLVHEALGVPKERIYVVCTDVPAHMWGFNGSTFG
jgi:phenylpyruvate tautomerase